LSNERMNALLKEVRHNPMLWLLVIVPVVFAAAKLKPEAHTLLFVLSVLAIVPLAALLSHATESVAAKTGDAAGGLLNATLGNLTELVIAITALRAGEYMLVKASIAGAIVTNTLFMLGASFLLGGLKHHVQEYNRVSARMQAALLFLAAIALLIPSAVAEADSATRAAFTQKLSLGLAVLLIVAYGLWGCCSRSRRTASCSPVRNTPTHRRRRSAVADRTGPRDAGRCHDIGRAR
jgi:Ca2+:H+ antiporter